MLVFLRITDRPLHVDPPELYRVAMGVARGEMEEREVAEWLRRNLSPGTAQPSKRSESGN
jgi:prophage maintenance system killer protein